MTEMVAEQRILVASDGYPLNVAVWVPESVPRAHVVMLHGVQSHAGWYANLGSVLARQGYQVSFPDRRGSGSHERERGHAPSARRLILDLAEWIDELRRRDRDRPIVLGGISWGGKLAVVTAARDPDRVAAVALICPGLHPRVGVSIREKLAIFWAYLTNPYKTFPIPLSDPTLFTANPFGQAFIAGDRSSLREGTAGLLVSSVVIDLMVKRAKRRVHQPVLLMLAGEDRIVDNARTLEYFNGMKSAHKALVEYPHAHHTLEFEPEPSRYALDLVAWLEKTLT